MTTNKSRPATHKPAAIPTVLEGSADPRGLSASSAVPADASVDTVDYVSQRPRQLIVTWHRLRLPGSLADWAGRGVAIWQLDRAAARARWHRVFTRETPLDRATRIVRYVVIVGDASGDGRPEALIFAYADGSGGWGTYRLFADSGYRLRQVFVRRMSEDRGTIFLAHHTLIVREGLDYRGPGIHCCYRKLRETRLRWNGRSMVSVSQVVRRNRRGWPPG